VGDTFSLRAHNGRPHAFTVDRILSSESDLVAADLLLMNEKEFRSFFGLQKGFATDLAVTVRNPLEMGTIARKIVDLFPDARPITAGEMARTYDAVFDWRGGMILVFFITSLFAFAILVWDKSSGASADERREIGVLKAVGWDTGDVILLKVWESLVLSLLSFVLGVALAYAHIFEGSAFLFSEALKGWSTLYPRFRLVPFVGATEIAVVFALTVVPYGAATLVPSWRSAIVDPDAVMRA
jgi:ABC-type lipoprotein release transport system permease subunit